jgi:hypothetical protein
MKNTRNLLGYTIIALILAGTVWSTLSEKSEAKPMMATGMTEKQRDENDSEILLDELRSSYGVERVEIQYGYDAIKIYLKAKSSDQYISDKASDLKDAIPGIIERNRADLTLEKEPGAYYIYIYGKDGHLIN